MKKNIFLFCIFSLAIFFSQQTHAQYWQWAKGATMPGGQCESGYSVVDSKGNVYAIGYFSSQVIHFDNDSITSNSPGNSFLVKYDSVGNVIWARCSQGSSQVDFDRIEIDGTDNIYICGLLFPGTAVFGNDTLINSTTDRCFLLVKFDSNGNEKWMRKAIGYSGGRGLDLDSHANILVTGYFSHQTLIIDSITLNNSSTSYADIFIAKYDSSGNIIFAKSISGNSSEFSFELAVDNANNFYVTGLCQGFTNQMTFDTYTIPIINRDLFFAKYSENGNCIWVRTAPGEDDWVTLAVDNHTNIYLTGATPSNLFFGNDTVTNYGTGINDEACFFVKYDSAGNKLWTKQSLGGGYCMGFTITPDNHDHLFVQGGFSNQDSVSVTFDSLTLAYPGGGVDPLFLLTYDLNGNILCSETLQSGGDDWAKISIGNNCMYMCGDFIQNSNGDPFVIGNDSLYGAGGNSENFFIARYHPCFVEEPNNINSVSGENGFTLFPNPTSDQITISNSSLEIISLHIINLLGEKIKEEKINSTDKNISISVKDLTNGIYFIQIKTNESSVTEKFVKE